MEVLVELDSSFLACSAASFRRCRAVVAVRGLHLNGGEAVVVLADFQQGDIEGAATQIEDQDALIFLALFQTVGQCGGGRLVDDTQHVQAGDLTGILGGLTLGVVEVGRAGDHRVGDRLAQVCFGVALELHQDLRGNLLRGPLLAVDLDGPVGAHVALDRADGAVDVGDGLTLGDFADQDFAGLGECDHGRGGAHAFGVHDDGGFAAFKRCDAGIRGAKIDTNCTSHNYDSLCMCSVGCGGTLFSFYGFPAHVSFRASRPVPKLEPTSLNFPMSTFIPNFLKNLSRYLSSLRKRFGRQRFPP